MLLVPLIERGFGSRDVTLLGVASSFVFLLPALDNQELKCRFDVLGLLVSVRCGWVGRTRQHDSSAARGSMQAWLS